MFLKHYCSSDFLKYFGIGKSEAELNLGLQMRTYSSVNILKSHTILLQPRFMQLLFQNCI